MEAAWSSPGFSVILRSSQAPWENTSHTSLYPVHGIVGMLYDMAAIVVPNQIIREIEYKLRDMEGLSYTTAHETV